MRHFFRKEISILRYDVKKLVMISAITIMLLFITPAVPNPYQGSVYAQQTELINELDSTLNIVNTTLPDTGLAGAVIPGQYIVLLNENATNGSASPQAIDALFRALNQTILTLGFNVISQYKDVGILVIKESNEQRLNITTARLHNLLDQLRSDPNVQSVVPDVTVIEASQTLPKGVDRVDGDLSYAKSGDGSGNVDVDIAILDTGVNKHDDLNVYSQVSYVLPMSTFPGDPYVAVNDYKGHGTHVAGIAAAKDNLEGVVGVAPGARIWSVKVLKDVGDDEISRVIAGVRYVTEHADEIDVANLSLGFPISSANRETAKEFLEEIQKSVNAGVVYVAAAMNGNAYAPRDASLWVPAAFPDVIAVSAITDIDGKCGGVGLPIAIYHPSIRIINREVVRILVPVINPDDSFASYSNYGSKISISAPGTNIYSTYLHNGYKSLSGTSMASPHVAGAAALYKAIHPNAAPSEVLMALINLGSTPDTVCDGNGHGYFTGDSDGIPEPLLYLKNIERYKSIDLTIHVPYPFPFRIIPEDIPPGGPIPPPPPPPQANTTEIIVSRPSNGTLSINQDSGALAYIPNPDFYGEDSFRFTINGTDIATITILLNKSSSVPTAQQ